MSFVPCVCEKSTNKNHEFCAVCVFVKSYIKIYFCCYFFLRGTRQKVKTTGHVKTDLMKNRRGKVVSKAANKAGKKIYKKNGLQKWNTTFMQARKNLKIKGFVPCKK